MEAPVRARFLSLLLPVFALTACDDGASTSNPTDSNPEPQCEVVDCDNPACAEVEECTWPTSLELLSDLDFAGGTIDCVFPIPIDDCVTNATSTLTQVVDGTCPSCDRTYTGALTYQKDTCSELIKTTPPTSATVGIVFVSDTSRELWSKDGTGSWSKSADLTGDHGVFTYTTVTPIRYDVEECGEGEQEVGKLTAVLTFTDAP
jgi:hypothetical protein